MRLESQPAVKLRWDLDGILKGLKSLAVELAEVLLNDVEGDKAAKFYDHYGPSSPGALELLLSARSGSAFQSIEYLQEYVMLEHARPAA